MMVRRWVLGNRGSIRLHIAKHGIFRMIQPHRVLRRSGGQRFRPRSVPCIVDGNRNSWLGEV